MDIYIECPIRVSITVVEFDERVPSMKFSVEVFVEKFDCSMSIKKTCWIECAIFDSFIKSLRCGRDARIEDMGKEFSLFVDAGNSQLIWSCTKEDIASNTIAASGEEVLLEGAKERILQAFEGYPRWW